MASSGSWTTDVSNWIPTVSSGASGPSPSPGRTVCSRALTRAENWANLASLIGTCKLNDVNPQTYFTDLLTHLVNGWPQARIDKLMPINPRRGSRPGWLADRRPGWRSIIALRPPTRSIGSATSR
jgi:hypothetical protein